MWLAVLGMLNSAVGAYYYLRVLVVMYMNEPGEATMSIQPVGAGIGATLWVAAVGTLVLGHLPVGAAELRHQFQRAGEVTEFPRSRFEAQID